MIPTVLLEDSLFLLPFLPSFQVTLDRDHPVFPRTQRSLLPKCVNNRLSSVHGQSLHRKITAAITLFEVIESSSDHVALWIPWFSGRIEQEFVRNWKE